MTRRGYIGAISVSADRIAAEQASTARSAAIEQRREAESARAAAAAARRAAPRPKPAPVVQPATPAVSAPQRGAGPSTDVPTRVVPESEYRLMMRAVHAVLKKF